MSKVQQAKVEWLDGPILIDPIRARDRKTGAVGYWCERVSPGCVNCTAAEAQKTKLKGKAALPDYRPEFLTRLTFLLDPAVLRDVLTREQPSNILWENQSDLFGQWVSNAWLDACFATMLATPRHTHYILTKRIERARDYLAQLGSLETWTRRLKRFLPSIPKALHAHVDEGLPPLAHLPWPLKNVRIGTSFEDQVTAERRLPHLLKTDAVYRFANHEPALGAVTLRWAACTCQDKPAAFKLKLHDKSCALYPNIQSWVGLLHRVNIGGEYGTGARPNYLQWTRSAIRQGIELNVRVFVAQLGSYPTTTPVGTQQFEQHPTKVVRLKLKSRKGTNAAEWPEEYRQRDFYYAPQR